MFNFLKKKEPTWYDLSKDERRRMEKILLKELESLVIIGKDNEINSLTEEIKYHEYKIKLLNQELDMYKPYLVEKIQQM